MKTSDKDTILVFGVILAFLFFTYIMPSLEKQFNKEKTSLKEGMEVKGIVKNLTDYGAFVDLGGVDGLLHITDMSWKRVGHPSELLTVGDEIDIIILKFEKERGRVSLGMKQLGGDPWANLIQRFPEGKRMKGTVTNVADYGCFVEKF